MELRPIRSQEVEPFAARIIGFLGMSCEAVKDDPALLMDRCVSLWWAVRGLDHIAIAIRSPVKYDNPAGVHFSIAMSNERSRIGQYIKAKTGRDPETDPAFKSHSL